MRKAFSIAFLLIFSVIISPCRDYAVEDEGQIIRLYLGETKNFPVSNVTRIAIANPNILDVTGVTKTSMILSPKARGTTTLVFWDNFGEQSFKVKVFSEDIMEVKRRIDNMLEKSGIPTVTTRAEEDEGKVLLMGSVIGSQERERINILVAPYKDKIIDLLDVKEEESVIEIDVQVLEIDKDSTTDLGFTWPSAINFMEVGSPGITAGGTTWGKIFKLTNVERATSTGMDPFTLTLDLLIQEGKAKVLSRPRLACQSGKEAELLVGGEKPIFTTSVQSTAGTSTEVEYKEYGIKLKVKPTVTDEDRIKLALNVEVSEIGTAETIGAANAPTAKAYPLTKRNASTELFLDNGQTMAIGGLIKQKREEDVRRVPLLSKLPVIGAAFRNTVTKQGGGQGERGDVELFITLTPKILADGRAMRKKSAAEPQVKQPEPKPQAVVVADDPISSYAGVIQKRVIDNLMYPASAKSAGFQGTTKIGLHLSHRGELMDAVIRDSSGYKVLDDSALAAAKGISLYPPFPSSVKDQDLWLDIPIVYKID